MWYIELHICLLCGNEWETELRMQMMIDWHWPNRRKWLSKTDKNLGGVAFLLHIREVLVQILTHIRVSQVYYGFPLLLQANIIIIPEVLPSKSFRLRETMKNLNVDCCPCVQDQNLVPYKYKKRTLLHNI